MCDTSRKYGKKEMDENDEQMKQGAHQKGKRGTAMATLEEGATRGKKGPRRTLRKAKARTRTEGTGGEKETGGAENRREPTTSRKGQKKEKDRKRSDSKK